MPTKELRVSDTTSDISSIAITYGDESKSSIPSMTLSVRTPNTKDGLMGRIVHQTIVQQRGRGYGRHEFTLNEKEEKNSNIVIEGNLFNALGILEIAGIMNEELRKQILGDNEIKLWLENTNQYFELPDNTETQKEGLVQTIGLWRDDKKTEMSREDLKKEDEPERNPTPTIICDEFFPTPS